MILFGALAFGVFVFFAVGLATGHSPRIPISFGAKRNRADTANRQIWLTQAGLDLSPVQYYIGLGAAFVVVLGLFAAITAPPVALAPAVVAVVIPHAFFNRRREQNVALARQGWPDAIREIIASIESNASLHGALAQLAYRGPSGIREAFERFPMLASTAGVVPALESVRERLGDPTSDRVIEVLILAHERGGAVVTEILRDLAHSTSDDLQLIQEIETSQLEQKLNSRAVFAIPWGLLILLVLVNPNFKSFYSSFTGYAVVLACGVVSAIGMLIMTRLTKIPSEPRVFGGSAVSNPSFMTDDEELTNAE